MGMDNSSDEAVEIKVHQPREGNGDGRFQPVSGPGPAAVARPPPPPPRVFDEFTPFRRWTPWLVPSFVAANIVVFMAIMYVNDCPGKSGSCVCRFLGRFSFQPLKENPLLGPSSDILVKMGALDMQKVVQGHQAWRIFTCIWLHAGLFHVLANMLSLLAIGIRLEQEFGFIRIGLLYVISGFGGSLLSGLFIQSNISVGASGALFGLLGSMLSELITNWTIYANKLAALLTLLFIIVLNLALGILPHVDNFAHIGGFLTGFFLGFIFLIRPQFGWVSQKHAPPVFASGSIKPKHKAYQYVLCGVSSIVLITGFTVGLIMLFRGVNASDYCSWCHYLSCVPTSMWSCNSDKMYCESTQSGNLLNLTCLSNGRSNLYVLSGDNKPPGSLEQLCSQLCR